MAHNGETNENQEPTLKAGVPEDAVQEALRAVEERERQGRRADSPQELANRIEQLERDLAFKAQEVAEFKDKYLRAMADLDNMRKRMLREREEARHYGAEHLLRDLLVVLDNLERAMQASGDVTQIREGVRLTHDQFKHILRQHGVEVIEAAGAPFDPAHHEAVAHIETEVHPPGVVVEEHRRGYRYRERLLRPAMVSVAKPKSAEANQAETRPD